MSQDVATWHADGIRITKDLANYAIAPIYRLSTVRRKCCQPLGLLSVPRLPKDT